ncbi:unnamed protein product, partial [Rotaria socialis]
MSIGLRKTVSNLLEALINEKAVHIKCSNENTIIATIADAHDSKVQHTITA